MGTKYNGRLNLKQLDSKRYVVINNYYFIDTVNKTIEVNEDEFSKDAFTKSIEETEEIKTIDVHKWITRDKETKEITRRWTEIIINEDIIIELDENNCLWSYTNNKVKKIEDGFLDKTGIGHSVTLENVEEIGDNLISTSEEHFFISLPKVKKIGNNFLSRRHTRLILNMPELEEVGDNFCEEVWYLHKNTNLRKLKKTGKNFLYLLSNLTDVILIPSLENENYTNLGDNVKKYCKRKNK